MVDSSSLAASPPDSVPGYAFHPGGRVVGVLSVDGEHLRFAGEGVSLALPFAGLERELGGFNDSVLSFRHPNQPQVTLHTSELSLLDHPRFAADPVLRRQVRVARRRRANGPLLVGCLLLLAGALIAGLLWAGGALVSWVAERVPIGVVAQLGERSGFGGEVVLR